MRKARRGALVRALYHYCMCGNTHIGGEKKGDSPFYKPLLQQTAKFGERLKSKTTTAQVNEALRKVLCHNLCVVIQSMYELNITPEFMSEAAEQSARTKQKRLNTATPRRFKARASLNANAAGRCPLTLSRCRKR